MSGVFGGWLVSIGGWLRRLVGASEVDPLEGVEPERARLVVGLGNPGPEYVDTRHNVGFRCVDELALRVGTRWFDRTADFYSCVARGQRADLTLVLAKPTTFMNRSGEAVIRLIDHLGLRPEHCLVVYDDMDLPFGSLRLRGRGSPGTHNGMRSVVSSLATDALPRLRIGISQASGGSAINHVLGEFDPNERQAAHALVERAADAALAWAIDGPALAMNRYNSAQTAP